MMIFLCFFSNFSSLKGSFYRKKLKIKDIENEKKSKIIEKELNEKKANLVETTKFQTLNKNHNKIYLIIEKNQILKFFKKIKKF